MSHSRASSATDQLEPFDLQTMSGVRPGTRTSVFQRLRISATEDPNHSARWFLLSWDQNKDEARLVALNGDHTQPDKPQPVLQIPHPGSEEFAEKLQQRLTSSGLVLEACGTCASWHRTNGRTPEGLPLGRCTHRNATGPEGAPDLFARQSALALNCAAWQPRSEIAHCQNRTTVKEEVADLPAPSRKERRVRSALLQRFVDLFSRKGTSSSETPSLYTERSGVGAGTGPCFACQARIANLGALTVDTPEGDQETFSVWRCRHCGTTYLNDWIDRWARLDSLETEETYYRIPPVEASSLLALFTEFSGSKQAERLAGPDVLREKILDLVQLAVPLSHQKRLGR